MGDSVRTPLHPCTAREVQLRTNPGPTSSNNLQPRSICQGSLPGPRMLINHPLCLQHLKWVIPSKRRWSGPLPRVAYRCHKNSKSDLEKGRTREFRVTHIRCFSLQSGKVLGVKQNPRWGRGACILLASQRAVLQRAGNHRQCLGSADSQQPYETTQSQ